MASATSALRTIPQEVCPKKDLQARSAAIRLEPRRTQARQTLEKQLQQLHASCSTLEARLRVDRVKAGKVITELKAFFRHGDWMPYSEKLYARLKVSRKTAERYVEAYEQVQALGEPLVAEAKKAGLDIDRIPVREKLIEIRHDNPTASPSKIVKLTKVKLQEEKAARLEPKPQSFDVAKLTADVSSLRCELTKLPMLGDTVSDATELGTLMRNLQLLAQDAQAAAAKLGKALMERAA